jgi:hypothetical protein
MGVAPSRSREAQTMALRALLYFLLLTALAMRERFTVR